MTVVNLSSTSIAMPSIPPGWIVVKLRDVGEISSGGTPSASDESNFGGDIAWVTPADLSGYSEVFIQRGRRNLSSKGYSSSSATLVKEGTVLFSSRAPIGYVAIAANKLATNQGFKNLTLYGGVEAKYVFYYLKNSKRLAEGMASGTTFLELSGSKFAQIPMPLPPLAEQTRIVAKIEELFSKLDAGVAGLKRTQILLKRYRQSLLHAAVTGELTRAWREQQGEGLADAADLLNDILAEHRHQWEKSGKKGKYKEPAAPDVGGLPELPQGWVWASVEQLAERTQYGTSAKTTDERHGVPLCTGHLRVEAVLDGKSLNV